ncbi:MAG: GDP-mannose 4,6-dehydratase [Candidatus Dadabacteria bacterium]|nr:GDP-mannose 4,6-dehydratase [Candidatus Dadabacteria bacterium]NIS07997.1 GDP-mannose 4,6-dehydratase [Candidatus Dadabacteria bacterium]NIV41914.1 GDP-mannose 4,6-dehydratase [Candidatus Dadabacteria bacterium]NIX16366.1 GDP-mannose 4,6-dehydratase [Candidatus Dadabacteria bacterium]NIY22965.1 GDP-mannose 4,6-dehydratase [Candidatus Dadabacteria bacterium]
MKKAFITGITGQDGSYLAELLLSKDYEVHGLIRRASTFNTERIDHIYVDPHDPNAKLYLHYGDLSETSQLTNLLYQLNPDEIYHLGAQSHVRVSFDIPEYTEDITGLGTVRILEAIRRGNLNSKFYQASSSEMYGGSQAPQSEDTPFRPRSPYACAKLMSFWTTANYREGYNLFASNGILFNHESPRRGQNFVTRKVTRAVSNIKAGNQDYLYLGNLQACRDWGYAPEYVELMWKILQHDTPDDYVIGTGETHSVGEFVREAFSYVGLDWEKHVKIDSKYYRPTEVQNLQADSTKAKTELNWELKIKFSDLIKIMIDSDMRKQGLDPPGEGDSILSEYYPKKWWKVD